MFIKRNIYNSLSSVMALAVNVGLVIWLQQYLISRITIEEYALLPVVYSFMIFLPLFSITLTGGLGRFLIGAHAEKNYAEMVRIVSSSTIILILFSIAFCLLWLMLTAHIEKVINFEPQFESDVKIMFVFLGAGFLIKLLLSPYSVGLEMTHSYVVLNTILTIGQIVRAVLLVSVLTLFSTQVLWVVVITFVSEACTQLFVAYHSMKRVRFLRFSLKYIKIKSLKQQISFGGWSTLLAISLAIKNGADALILNKFGTPNGASLFYLASLPFTYVNRLISAALNPITPQMIEHYVHGRTEDLKRVFLFGGKLSLWVSLGIVAPVVLFSQELVLLYLGNGFEELKFLFILFLVIIPFEQSTRMLFPLVEAHKKQKQLAIFMVVFSFMKLTFAWYFVYFLQLDHIGSASSTLLAIGCVYSIFLIPYALRLADLKFSEFSLYCFLPGVSPSIFASFAVFLFKDIFDFDSVWMLLLMLVFYSVVYCTGLFFFGLTKSERKKAISLIHKQLFV